jgi:hypothetical protein
VIPVHVQEQAFRVYYASMTDAQLLATAANKRSFIPLAQSILDAELAHRHLAVPGEAPPAAHHQGAFTAAMHKLRGVLHV